MGSPRKTDGASASCAPLRTLIHTCSDSMSVSTIERSAGITRSNESGTLIPSPPAPDRHLAVCGSDSAGMRSPRAVGESELIQSNVKRPTLGVHTRQAGLALSCERSQSTVNNRNLVAPSAALGDEDRQFFHHELGF